MAETLSFCIEGNFITTLARQWFWNENQPYEKSENLLLSCLNADGITKEQQKTIAQEIIEGRKQLTGNSHDGLYLTEDNENIRPIQTKLQELEKKLKIKEIEDAIRHHGIWFVDPASTVKSINEAERYNITTEEECVAWFKYPDREYTKWKYDREYVPTPFILANDDTECGLWLFNYPELIYEASKNNVSYGSEEFWENIYELTKNKKWLEIRNRKYLTQKKIKEEKELQWKNLLKSQEDIDTTDNTEAPPIKDESFSQWSGLVSPQGDFYPCGFGDHNYIAYKILKQNYNDIEDIKIDKALDELIQKEWIALRYINFEYYLEYKDKYKPTSRWKPTKIQKDIVWEQCVRHEIPTDIIPETFY